MSPLSMRDAGTRMLLLGRARLAASMLRRVVSADPTDDAARHNLALALRALGDDDAALAQAEASVERVTTPEGLTLAGHLRLLTGDQTGGEAALRQAAAGDHAPAHYLLGILWWSQDMRPEAAASLRAAQQSGLLRARISAQLRALEAGAPPGPLAEHTAPLAAEVRAPPPGTARTSTAPRAAASITPAQLAERIAQASCVVALTGSGLAETKGRRSRRQLWDQFHRDEAMSVWRFRENPVYLWSVIAGAQDGTEASPHATHRALSTLPLAAVLTQSVDGLHQQAGSAEVVELHGTLARTRCDRCGARYRVPVRGYIGGPLPPQCGCGGPIRPDVMLFGEPPPQEAVQAADRWLQRADLLLVIGCAMDVAPASEMPRRAAASGAAVVELRQGPSRLGGVPHLTRVLGPIAETLPAVIASWRETSR